MPGLVEYFNKPLTMFEISPVDYTSFFHPLDMTLRVITERLVH